MLREWCCWVYLGSCTFRAGCGDYEHVQEEGELPESCPNCQCRIEIMPPDTDGRGDHVYHARRDREAEEG